MNPLTDWPDDDEEKRLLADFATDARTAGEAVAERYWPLLVAFLRRTFSRVDDHLREEAAGTTLLDLVKCPERYKPELASLRSYLQRSARCDLLNLLRRENRARTVPLDSVAQPAEHRNDPRDATDNPLDDPRLAAEIEAFNADERATFELMCDEVRDTDEYAKRLGLSHLPTDERRAAVKRVKDRVQKRLVRARGELS
jgi:RNA polymerase sigma factor (sigma-70 family)